jgi:hypothetical protein
MQVRNLFEGRDGRMKSAEASWEVHVDVAPFGGLNVHPPRGPLGEYSLKCSSLFRAALLYLCVSMGLRGVCMIMASVCLTFGHEYSVIAGLVAGLSAPRRHDACLEPKYIPITNYQLPNGLIKVRRRWGQRHPQGANSGSNGKLKRMRNSKQLPRIIEAAE